MIGGTSPENISSHSYPVTPLNVINIGAVFPYPFYYHRLKH
jgi:hypothetical protein